MAGANRKKEILFAGVAVVSFFALLELVLALAGVRPVIRDEDPYVGFESYLPLFERDAGAGQRRTAANKLDFFNEQRFPERKAPGRFRIFTLGGSTTYGRPFEDGTSFSGWLRAYLKAAVPDREWEVVNCGAISYASYRVAKVMEELIEYEPDLFIIYSGNNEFLERRTYGDVIEQPAALGGLTRILGHSRIYALGRRIQRRGAEEARERYELTGEVEEILNRSTGLEAYYRDDELRERILAHYRFNLARMVEMARAGGAEVILVTIPVNEKDFPPFKSEFSAATDEAGRERVRELLAEARAALDAGVAEDARDLMAEAVEIDPRYADSHFMLGRALFGLNSFEEAGKAFRDAIEEDVCPLRALAGINATVVETARTSGAPLADFAAVLREEAFRTNGHDLLGDEFFLDHVHPNVDTNGRLSRLLVREIAALGGLSLAPDWQEHVGDVATEVRSRVDDDARARAYKNLSKVLIWAGRHAAAERYARQAGELLGEDWEVRYNLGVVKLEAGEYEAAISGFREAIRLNPQAVQAYDNLGTTYAALGDVDRAIAVGEQAVWIDPGLATVHSNLAASYLARGDLERALESASRAVDLDPALPDALNNLGNVYFAMDRLDDALRSYDRAIELQPNDARALVNRGLALGQAGRAEDAIASFERALEIEHRSADAHVGLGKVYLSLRQGAQAISSFEKALEIDGRDVEAYEWLARTHLADRRPDRAEEVLARGLRLLPESPLLHHLYARILGGGQRFDEAIRHFRLAITVSGESSFGLLPEDALRHGLATALLASGRPEEGLVELKRAASVNPANPLVQSDLGLVYEGSRKPEQALRHYERALELQPGLAAAVEGARRVKARSGAR